MHPSVNHTFCPHEKLKEILHSLSL